MLGIIGFGGYLGEIFIQEFAHKRNIVVISSTYVIGEEGADNRMNPYYRQGNLFVLETEKCQKEEVIRKKNTS
jgi:hypothetical protein